MKNAILFSLLILQFQTLFAQKEIDAEWRANKRQEVRDMLPDNSMAVFFSNAIRNRANDVNYHYHQDPNFFYLTGFKEPHSMLIIFKNQQTDAKGQTFDEVLFVQPHHYREELYDGPRLGVEGAKKELGFEYALFNTEFASFSLQIENLDKVLFFDFKNDVREERSKKGDLYKLIEQFKEKVDYPSDFNPYRDNIYQEIKNVSAENRERLQNYVRWMANNYSELAEDQIIANFLANDGTQIEQIEGQIIPPPSKLDALMLGQIMAKLREVKSPEEIELLRKAVDISCYAQAEVMKAMHPEMSETEVYGIHSYVYKKYGAMFEGYPGIVGAGHNGCVLHYIENDKERLGKDLVLMDLGAEFQGYTADVTRTIPANGKFSPEQKAIYNLVYKAQEEAFKICKPGEPIQRTTQVCREVIAEGLLELGLIQKKEDVGKYFPHGVSHHIGLDVHDPGQYELFEENMVLTVEPGIYIPEGAETDPKWWGIGVRIEDDILITKDGYELLSDKAPRTVEAIEALMQEESILSKFNLPVLDN